MKSILEIGQRFERLVVSAELGGTPRKYRCTCDCGAEKDVVCYQLTSGKTKSCGCLRDEMRPSLHSSHGMRNSREYKAWAEAKQRCHNQKNGKYKWYGARGIEMCAEWRNDFKAFFDHIGSCPDGYELDRKDNAKGYEPGNVRWVTHTKNVRNRRTTVTVKYQGKNIPLSEYCEITGIKYATAWAANKRAEAKTL